MSDPIEAPPDDSDLTGPIPEPAPEILRTYTKTAVMRVARKVFGPAAQIRRRDGLYHLELLDKRTGKRVVLGKGARPYDLVVAVFLKPMRAQELARREKLRAEAKALAEKVKPAS